ncbi:hypothetical protein CF645_07270 [Burkholderia pseudomallei]|nr:hypothetical protein T210_0141000 [Burkholderia pseudomallei MSHR6137]PNW93948.1 hypothetical protein CF640_17055 [Burkholderia pseudomallei]PNX23063.1 hypothetical protein CF645_07270 [Burkholderia pseudomallei]
MRGVRPPRRRRTGAPNRSAEFGRRIAVSKRAQTVAAERGFASQFRTAAMHRSDESRRRTAWPSRATELRGPILRGPIASPNPAPATRP